MSRLVGLQRVSNSSLEYHILLYPNGQFVAIDEGSGGYPYATNSISNAKLWPLGDGAEKYAEMFNKKINLNYGGPFKVKKLICTIVDI